MYDVHFYRFIITIRSGTPHSFVEEGIVYSTDGYVDALQKIITSFVNDESDLVSVDCLYPIESSADVIDMYHLAKIVKDYEKRNKE